jgi:hypothetical protein
MRTAVGGVIGHVLGIVGGALAAAAGWHVLGAFLGHPPRSVLGALAAVLTLVAARLLPVRLRGSPWRVPRTWSHLGHMPYAVVFGLALGTGMATALASPALYLVIAWGLTATNWAAVWPVFLAFGIGRAAPFMAISVHALRHRVLPNNALARGESIVPGAALAEGLILAFVVAPLLGQM